VDRAQAHSGRAAQVERRVSAVQPLEKRPRLADERGDIDASACGRERHEVVDPLAEQRARAVVIPPAPVVAANADLEDAAVEVPQRTGLRAPEQLERLVLLEEPAVVELRDRGLQLRRRRRVAAGRPRRERR